MESQKELFETSFQRPKHFFKLSKRRQWEIDAKLYILDFNDKDLGWLSPEERKRYDEHYDTSHTAPEDIAED